MEESFSQELEQHLNKLYKTIEQGDQIHNLTAAPEWEFFELWLRASEEKIVDKMKAGTFVNDHNGYIHASAATSVISNIFKGIDKFKKAYDKANKEVARVKKEQKSQ